MAGSDVPGMESKHPAWVDITATDGASARAFYAELFGWKLQLLEGANYALVQPGPGTLPGGIGEASPTQAVGIVTYFSVGDVEKTLARAVELGATVDTPLWTVPGLGTMAIFRDHDNNRIGLWSD
ncbi:VOC family protein [Kribbella sp. NPDC026611]|uniref:VOC family protein n=1 Tax=Kribbella sp. NPDC026611 TaxID=3154911 RepID=UPI0033DA5D34